jgi:myo-inositol-1(or 4)-monophosphatase
VRIHPVCPTPTHQVGPTLHEVLRHIDIPLMVDFGGGAVGEVAVAVVREARSMARALFVTGNVDALRRLRDLAPEARIGLTWTDRDPPSASLLRELGAEYWNPTFRLVTPERVAAMHRLGFKVSTWTVDTHRHMARVAWDGVDAIVSNRIARLHRFLT